MDILNLLISLASGALGGNVSGSSIKENNLGTVGNIIAGLVGGGFGHTLLQALGILGAGGADHSIMSILTNIATSGVGGALLPLAISFIRSAFTK